MDTLRLLLQVSFRNLLRSWVNLVIGLIILFATTLVVFGSAFIDSIDASMSRSVVGSIAGHLQAYSDASKDKIALFGGTMGDDPDLSPVQRFAQLREAVSRHPNVKQVVPQGTSNAIVTTGNTLDQLLGRLRGLYRAQAEQGPSAERTAQLESLKAHVRRLAGLMAQESENRAVMFREDATDPAEVEALARAQSDAFWADFEKDPLEGLEYLENRLAPQLAEGDMLYLRSVGTDLDKFQEGFELMELVDGQQVPRGERGLLVAKYLYEEFFKLKSARRLDRIKDALATGRRTIAADEELKRFVRENVNQTRDILFQLDPLKAKEATARLQRVLGSQEQDLGKLLAAFFDTNDANFAARYDAFYAQLAPLLELYRARPGDVLTLTTFTRSGYVKSVNVKMWGTFRFKGLEKSPTAGFINLMDLVSFRELYGQPTAEMKAEIAELKKAAGARAVARETAEEALFGGAEASPGAPPVVAEAAPGTVDIDGPLSRGGAAARNQAPRGTFAPSELEDGLVLSAAILLKDPSRQAETLEELRADPAVKAAGLRVVSWQEASGFFGQLILAMRVVLWFVVVVLCVVVLAVINNAMMMATLRRTREIGTMRAIGAQRGFVLAMVLFETVVLGLVFGMAGAALGSGLVAVVDAIGIPAFNDEMMFFFGGPRLHLFLSPGALVTAFVLVVVVSAVSTFYPALQATRVAPVTAMQTEE